MSTASTPDQRRDLARKILLDSARDLANDPMSIGELYGDQVSADYELTQEEWDAEVDALAELIRTATVTVEWAVEPHHPPFMIAVRGCDDCSSEPGKAHHPTCPRPAEVAAEREAQRIWEHEEAAAATAAERASETAS